MSGGRSKRRKTTGAAAALGASATSEKPESPCRPSVDGMLVAASSVVPGVDLFTQARKALSERCPFDSEEAVPRFGNLPSALAVNLHKKSDGRRKHRNKFQEVAAGKSVGPVRPLPASSVWEKSEEYFRPITLDDIDLLFPRLPPDSYFYLPSSEKLLVDVVRDETVLDESAHGETDVASSSVVIRTELENAEVAVSQSMQIDRDVSCSGALPVEMSETEDPKSLNWILGCKHRSVLTSVRPSRKKKLFGKDKGLVQLLLLPLTQTAGVEIPLCDFCSFCESDTKSNIILICDSCKVSVHQKCYGVHDVPAGRWLCSWCKYLEEEGRESQRNADGHDSSFRPCSLCPKSSGALKPVVENFECCKEKRFVHLFCSLWTPRLYVEDVGVMEPIMNLEGLQEPRRKMVCNLCKVKHGICVRCSHGTCRTSFHPVCAREAKHQMEIWGKFGHDDVELQAFCLKHSPVHNIDTFACEEHPSRISDDDVMHKILPPSMPIKRLPKIKITSKGKNKKKLVLELGTEGVDVLSNKTHGVVLSDNGNALQSTSDVIQIFRKIIDRRKINTGDVALELGVSSAFLGSAMTGEVNAFPSELKFKIIQWLQNFVHVQPSTCHLKSRNGDAISSGSLTAKNGGSSASCLNSRIARDITELPEVTESTVVKSELSCSIGVLSNCMNDMVSDTNDSVSENIEGRHLTELDVAETNLGNVTDFIDPNVSGEPFYEDSEVRDLKGVPDCSHLLVENNRLFDASITELKTDSLQRPEYDASLAGILNNINIEQHSWSSIHPFILKKLSELQCRWNFLEKRGNIEACCDDKLSTIGTKTAEGFLSVDGKLGQLENFSNTEKIDELEKAKNMMILEALPTDEVEGELLYLQNCLLDRTTSIKHSCEELIHRIIKHLPQELDAARRKGWDLVLVSQYLCEIKEVKKRGRKEKRHTEAQAVLAAATAATTASRTSALRKDAIDGNGSSQQNPPKNNTATRRVTVHFPSVTRPKEAVSRSSVAKVSTDKHSGDFKFPDFAKENALFCDVCWRTETIVNRIFVCFSCKVAVHLDCYRWFNDPTGPWRCELCDDSSFHCASPRNEQLDSSEKSYSRALCSLCGGVSGAFRKSTDGEWVHAFCAEWLLESTYKRGQQNLVGGMDSISKDKDVNTCSICLNRFGLCLKCSYGHCQAKFHPSCARNAGLFLNIKAIGGRFQHKAYCEKHSVEQREKVDSQHDAEELRSIKHVRVDLEKLRLLCERIIKREKVKRDLVVCSHGILASRRDCVAFSAMVRSSFAPGISSESATTSIDNPSYSGAMQRSDDITFDSTVHGRNFSGLHMDMDRKTDDSLTFQLPNKRKIASRNAFSGKQLPQRSTIRAPNVADGGEVKLKDKKGMNSLEKEKVMTSYQASLQNQRLPKGFVYVPVGSPEKDTSAAAHDSEPCELQEPGG